MDIDALEFSDSVNPDLLEGRTYKIEPWVDMNDKNISYKKSRLVSIKEEKRREDGLEIIEKEGIEGRGDSKWKISPSLKSINKENVVKLNPVIVPKASILENQRTNEQKHKPSIRSGGMFDSKFIVFKRKAHNQHFEDIPSNTVIRSLNNMNIRSINTHTITRNKVQDTTNESRNGFTTSVDSKDGLVNEHAYYVKGSVKNHLNTMNQKEELQQDRMNNSRWKSVKISTKKNTHNLFERHPSFGKVRVRSSIGIKLTQADQESLDLINSSLKEISKDKAFRDSLIYMNRKIVMNRSIDYSVSKEKPGIRPWDPLQNIRAAPKQGQVNFHNNVINLGKPRFFSHPSIDSDIHNVRNKAWSIIKPFYSELKAFQMK